MKNHKSFFKFELFDNLNVACRKNAYVTEENIKNNIDKLYLFVHIGRFVVKYYDNHDKFNLKLKLAQSSIKVQTENVWFKNLWNFRKRLSIFSVALFNLNRFVAIVIDNYKSRQQKPIKLNRLTHKIMAIESFETSIYQAQIY